MIQFTVIFFEDETGACPVEEFLVNLSPKMRARLLGILEILQEKGTQLREPYSKHLDDGIFEIRAKVGTDLTRILYFFYHNGKIILTNGFIKKTMKTPASEIKLAKKRRKDYLERSQNL